MQAADLDAEAKEPGYDIGDLANQIAAIPDAVPVDASAGTTADAASVSPDAQAQIDQANAKATASARGAPDHRQDRPR